MGQFLTNKADHAAKERALLEREDLSAKAKKPLQAFLRMERVAAESKAQGYDRGNIPTERRPRGSSRAERMTRTSEVWNDFQISDRHIIHQCM